MQNSSQPKLIPTPFADNGARQNIPNDSQIGITAGRASYTDGFPPLTRTPLAAGGVPPFGTDFNGVLNDITAALRWSQSGSAYPFNAAFNTAISGYPKGARIPNSTLDGYWLNTIDGNTANPEVTGASITGWVPIESYGITTIAGLSGSSITLTTLQAAKDTIILSGTLSSNISLFFPAWIKQWNIKNNCSGAFSVTIKTPNGTGVALTSGSNAMLQGDGVNINQGATQGSLINVQVFTASSMYTPTAGVKTAIVKISGAGAGSGGCGGTGTNQVVISAGGGSGSGVVALISNPAPSQITIGSGGVGGSSSVKGGAGGSSSFGSYITAGGGYGSAIGLSKNSPAFGIGDKSVPGITTNNCQVLNKFYGCSGDPGFVTPNGDAISGQGAPSMFGNGGNGNGSQGAASPGLSAGSGASGVCNNVGSFGSELLGAKGADGLCIVMEYA